MVIDDKLNIENILNTKYYFKGDILVNDGSIPTLSGSFSHNQNKKISSLEGFINDSGRLTQLNGACMEYEGINIISMVSVLPSDFGPIGGEFYFLVKKNSNEVDNLSGNYTGYKTAVDFKLFNGSENGTVSVKDVMEYVQLQNGKGFTKDIDLSVSLR